MTSISYSRCRTMAMPRHAQKPVMNRALVSPATLGGASASNGTCRASTAAPSSPQASWRRSFPTAPRSRHAIAASEPTTSSRNSTIRMSPPAARNGPAGATPNGLPTGGVSYSCTGAIAMPMA
jgi:hypothetical protein